MTQKTWWVYLLQSERRGTYYIGITVDTARRLQQHNAGKGGCHTRTRRPWKMLYSIECDGMSEALKLEAKLKKIPAAEKEAAFTGRLNMHGPTDGDVQQHGSTTTPGGIASKEAPANR